MVDIVEANRLLMIRFAKVSVEFANALFDGPGNS